MHLIDFFHLVFTNFDRHPDEEAGEIPMAFIVRRPGSTLSSVAVMDFVAKQVSANSLHVQLFTLLK